MPVVGTAAAARCSAPAALAAFAQGLACTCPPREREAAPLRSTWSALQGRLNTHRYGPWQFAAQDLARCRCCRFSPHPHAPSCLSRPNPGHWFDKCPLHHPPLTTQVRTAWQQAARTRTARRTWSRLHRLTQRRHRRRRPAGWAAAPAFRLPLAQAANGKPFQLLFLDQP